MRILIAFTPFCLQNWTKLTARAQRISSRCGRVGSPWSVVVEEVVGLGWPWRARERRRRCTVRAGSGWEVWGGGGAVSAARVSVVVLGHFCVSRASSWANGKSRRVGCRMRRPGLNLYGRDRGVGGDVGWVYSGGGFPAADAVQSSRISARWQPVYGSPASRTSWTAG